jgi:hypothetical protein
MRKYYFGNIRPRYSAEYSVCGFMVVVFHYFKEEGETKKETPFKKHLTDINRFEGIYHPSVKIKGYPDITIDEFGIFNGQEKIYSYSGNNKNKNINLPRHLIIGLLVCGYHALKLRLFIDVSLVNKGNKIDPNHLNAYKITVRFIEYHNSFLRNDDPCKQKLNRLFVDIKSVESIYSIINDQPKEFVIEEYNKIKNAPKIKLIEYNSTQKKLFE